MMLAHMKREHYDEKNFKCDNCGLRYKNYSGYKGHFNKKHNERADMFKCDKCTKTFRKFGLFNKHTNSIHNALEGKNFKCNVCGVAYSEKYPLISHVRTKHDNEQNELSLKEEQCDICEKRFRTTNQLNVHIVYVHGQSRDFKCDQCEEYFIRQTDVTRHLESFHKSLMKCELCQKSYTSMNSLKNHIQVHYVM